MARFARSSVGQRTAPIGLEQKPMNISVVVPTYNRAGLISATLDSILTQDTPAGEVIVVDDGSTDATPDVLANYRHRVRVVRVANGGANIARNIGLRTASGQLVAFCDSDDLWRPGFLTAMAALWHHAPDLMTAYGNFQFVRDDVWSKRTIFDEAPPGFWKGLRPVAQGLGVFEQPILGRLIGAGLSLYQPFYPSAMVVARTSFLNAGGWDEAVDRMQDYATFLRAAERQVGIVLHPLVGYRQHRHNDSIIGFQWHDNSRHTLNRRIIVHAGILAHVLATRPALAPHRAELLARIGELADFAFEQGDFVAYREIQAMLPLSHRPIRRKLKGWISYMPAPAARRVAELAKSVRAHIRSS